MTDYSKLKHEPESNMEALKSAIVNGEEEHLKMLLTNYKKPTSLIWPNIVVNYILWHY